MIAVTTTSFRNCQTSDCALMHVIEIWIDVECHGTGKTETLCTLFADKKMPMRPQIGETLSFHQSKGSTLEFSVVLPTGPARSTNVRVEIEDVSHYAVNSDGEVIFKTAMRCCPVVVPTKEDARMVCKLMTEQLGFEIDPYGINSLSEN